MPKTAAKKAKASKSTILPQKKPAAEKALAKAAEKDDKTKKALAKAAEKDDEAKNTEEKQVLKKPAGQAGKAG